MRIHRIFSFVVIVAAEWMRIEICVVYIEFDEQLSINWTATWYICSSYRSALYTFSSKHAAQFRTTLFSCSLLFVLSLAHLRARSNSRSYMVEASCLFRSLCLHSIFLRALYYLNSTLPAVSMSTSTSTN